MVFLLMSKLHLCHNRVRIIYYAHKAKPCFYPTKMHVRCHPLKYKSNKETLNMDILYKYNTTYT